MGKLNKDLICRLIIAFVLFAVSLACLPLHPVVEAEEMENLPANQSLSEPGFFAGENVRVEGQVDGASFASGYMVQIDGDINGPLFASASQVIINGKVKGPVFAAGQTVQINGEVEGDVFAVGANVMVGSDAKINRDAFLGAVTINQDGPIGRHLFAGASNLTINDQVGGQVNAEADKITVSDQGQIDGDFNYSSPQEAQIANADQIKGELAFDQQISQQDSIGTQVLQALQNLLWGLLAAVLVWWVFRWLRPSLWLDLSQSLLSRPLQSLAFGFLFILLLPVLALLLIFSRVGLPLALMALALWMVLIYISQMICAQALGDWLFRKMKKEQLAAFWSFLLGLVILQVLFLIPYLALLIRLLVVCFGVGAAIRQFKNQLRPSSKAIKA